MAATCDGVTWEGCCVDGVVRWCEDVAANGPLCAWDCGGDGQQCGWAGAYYWCGADSAEGPPEFPLVCCESQCDGKVCGGTCGLCAFGETCVAGVPVPGV